MKELTSYHVDVQLVGAAGPVALGEADSVRISVRLRKSVRKPRRSAPQTSMQGHEPFEIAFKRGAYNGSVDALLEAAKSPLTAPSLQMVVTKVYPQDGTTEQWLYTGITAGDGSFESTADSTDEDISFTADDRKRLA
jgi:hypothetical protein